MSFLMKKKCSSLRTSLQERYPPPCQADFSFAQHQQEAFIVQYLWEEEAKKKKSSSRSPTLVTACDQIPGCFAARVRAELAGPDLSLTLSCSSPGLARIHLRGSKTADGGAGALGRAPAHTGR